MGEILHQREGSPRVGDGFIRLDVDGTVTYASPNALSAYHRMGLSSELEGHNLVVTVPLPDRKLCGNAGGMMSRQGHIYRNKLIKAQREVARCEGRDRLWGIGHHRAGEKTPPHFPAGRVLVTVEVWRDPLWAARRLDDDNLIRGLKATMDGLTDAGVWADDRQVQWGPITWETAQPYRGEVVLTLTEVRGE